MIILESILTTILITALGISVYTDITRGIISNKVVFYSLVCATLTNVVYYAIFAGQYLYSFCMNAGVLCFVAIALYALKIWGGGDSKLLFVIALTIPGRFYNLSGYSNNTSVLIVAFSFLVAFLVIVSHSLYLGINEGSLFSFPRKKIDIKRLGLSYFMMVSIVQLINIIITIFFSDYIMQNWIVLQMINCFLVLFLISVQSRISDMQLLAITLFSAISIYGLCFSKNVSLYNGVNWKLIPLTIFIIALRLLISKYCYRQIPTDEVKAGQILAASTIMLFQFSKVKGLPQGVSEDLNSKITEQEAASIKRWKDSKYGQEKILVVRKIPFAIYIAIGTALFLVFEVMRG